MSRTRYGENGCAWTGRTASSPRITTRSTVRQRMGQPLLERTAPGVGPFEATGNRCYFPIAKDSWQRQVERHGEEDRHLAAGDRLAGAVVAAAAAAGDAVRRELLDEAGRPVTGR